MDSKLSPISVRDHLSGQSIRARETRKTREAKGVQSRNCKNKGTKPGRLARVTCSSSLACARVFCQLIYRVFLLEITCNLNMSSCGQANQYCGCRKMRENKQRNDGKYRKL